MASASTPDRPAGPLATTVKLIVAGGFGVGKTTFVGAISEIAPVNTEAWMTETSQTLDPATPGTRKTTTTVAMDFGRLTIADDLVIYLFGTPGQDRFWFMWDDLCRGASGAVVLLDTRRLDISYPAINYLEETGLPFLTAVNLFDGHQTHPVAEIRDALDLPEAIPLVCCDARDRRSVAATLTAALTHTLALTSPAHLPTADRTALSTP